MYLVTFVINLLLYFLLCLIIQKCQISHPIYMNFHLKKSVWKTSFGVETLYCITSNFFTNRKARSLYGVSPHCKFGPKGFLLDCTSAFLWVAVLCVCVCVCVCELLNWVSMHHLHIYRYAQVCESLISTQDWKI